MTRSYVRDGAEIYRRSFATIRAEADLSRLPADVATVAVRMIHACGQVDLVDDLAFSPGVVAAARTALHDARTDEEKKYATQRLRADVMI